MDADGSHPRRITDKKGYDGGPFFSPDGRHIRFSDQTAGFPGEKGFGSFVYDVENGTHVPVPAGRDVGWTPDGDLLALTDKGVVRTCGADTGACQDAGLVVEMGLDSTVKLGGNPYES
jgi:Tol biopolymer transport system component